MSAARVWASSMVLASSNNCLKVELSLSALLLTLEDEHPCRIWAEVSRSMSWKSHVAAWVRSQARYESTFLSGFCVARRNLKISYDESFWGVKWSVSDFFVISYSFDIVILSSDRVVVPITFCCSGKLWSMSKPSSPALCWSFTFRFLLFLISRVMKRCSNLSIDFCQRTLLVFWSACTLKLRKTSKFPQAIFSSFFVCLCRLLNQWWKKRDLVTNTHYQCNV